MSETVPTPALFAALASAQAEAKMVAKDRKNQHHGYEYASADAIIEASKDLLAKHGLAVVALTCLVDTTRRDADLWVVPDYKGKDGRGVLPASPAMLCARYLVAHKSGESIVAESETPVVPEKGRPFDKAVGAAKTADLRYFLRGLLQFATGEADDIDAHVERPATQQPAQSTPKQEPLAPPDDPMWEALQKQFVADFAAAKTLAALDEIGGKVARAAGMPDVMRDVLRKAWAWHAHRVSLLEIGRCETQVHLDAIGARLLKLRELWGADQIGEARDAWDARSSALGSQAA